MSSSGEELPDESDLGRDMLAVSMDEAGVVQMEHKLTGKTFEFVRDDLDEVIGVLNIFRMQTDASELDDEPGGENGEA